MKRRGFAVIALGALFVATSFINYQAWWIIGLALAVAGVVIVLFDEA